MSWKPASGVRALSVTLFLVTFVLAACQEEVTASRPDPIPLTEEAAAHYCQMIVLEHPGPKAQVHLNGNPFPIWFTQVRDAVAFAQSPEESHGIAAIYVNDMADADWEAPGAGNWIAADEAHFVIESGQNGGMGAPEAVPFGDRQAAEHFARQRGGRIVQFADIPEDYVLAPVEIPDSPQTQDAPGG